MKILDRLPVIAEETEGFVGDERMRFHKEQIIIWMSITPADSDDPPSGLHRFPVILDTGHSFYFAMQEQHLLRWAGFSPGNLPVTGHIRHRGERVELRKAKLWLHQNEPGSTLFTQKCIRLNTIKGVEVFSDRNNHPRLPLLGLRALLGNDLYLRVDGKTKLVTLSTPDWRARIMRWL